METDPTRMCELLVGLPAVTVLGIDETTDGPLEVHIETQVLRPGCSTCGCLAVVKDRPVVVLVDLPAFGRPTRLCWHKRRLCCPDPDCPVGSWTEEDPRIGWPRMVMTDRAGRWVTAQVGRCARSVAEVARELRCDWHTVNAAVLSYGEVLVDDPGRVETVAALGLDETLMVRRGPRRRQEFATSIADVAGHQLLDVVPGRSAAGPTAWLEDKGQEWRDEVAFCTLDLSSTYRSVFDLMVPDALQVADPFHVVRHANTKLDECRRRVQNETVGHRGCERRRYSPARRRRNSPPSS